MGKKRQENEVIGNYRVDSARKDKEFLAHD
jgi:hypothetical protein